MPHDHVQKIKFLTPPQGPRGGWDPKNCAGACAIHVSNSHTKSGWISEKKKWPPTVPPKSHPWAWPRRPNENPVWYVIYLSFVRRYTKFGLKTFEIDSVIQIKWYLTFWPLPKVPGGQDQKNGAGACAIHVCNSHTKSGWISKKKKLTPPKPPTVPLSLTPGACPRWPNENPVWYVLYLSCVRR